MRGNCKNCKKEFSYNQSQSKGVWCSNRCQGDYKLKQRFIEGTRWNHAMRNLLIRERGEMCERCEIVDWNGTCLVFHVDHINGDRTDNRKENLKVLCPNCHSQTETFGSKNVSENGRLKMKESANNARRTIA